jgi:hypothetical protein
MRPDWRESNHHEVPLTYRLRELMPCVQSNDPRAIAREEPQNGQSHDEDKETVE